MEVVYTYRQEISVPRPANPEIVRRINKAVIGKRGVPCNKSWPKNTLQGYDTLNFHYNLSCTEMHSVIIEVLEDGTKRVKE